MPKTRKMLSDINAPYMQSLMRAIETQSVPTIARWCAGYAKERLLPLWERDFPGDNRPALALDAALDYVQGALTLSQAKEKIAACRSAAREAEASPIAQCAARAIDASASAIHNPTGSVGLALYGALAIAYSQAGIQAPWEALENLAAAECAKMEQALRQISVPNETNPAKIKWHC